MTAQGGSAKAEGKPGWLALSPMARSPEGVALEASIVAMKQALDLQASDGCSCWLFLNGLKELGAVFQMV